MGRYLWLILLCMMLSGCASYNGKTFWGSGKIKLDKEGNVLEMECASPISNLINIQGIKTQ